MQQLGELCRDASGLATTLVADGRTIACTLGHGAALAHTGSPGVLRTKPENMIKEWNEDQTEAVLELGNGAALKDKVALAERSVGRSGNYDAKQAALAAEAGAVALVIYEQCGEDDYLPVHDGSPIRKSDATGSEPGLRHPSARGEQARRRRAVRGDRAHVDHGAAGSWSGTERDAERAAGGRHADGGRDQYRQVRTEDLHAERGRVLRRRDRHAARAALWQPEANGGGAAERAPATTWR